MVTTNAGETVRVTLSLVTQPFTLVPVTVYVVVEPGLAVGFGQLVQLNPVPGLHV